MSEQNEYTKKELAALMRSDLFRIAHKKGMTRDEYYQKPFNVVVDWVYEHQNDPDMTPEDRQAAGGDPPADDKKSKKGSQKDGGVKTKDAKTEDAKSKPPARGRGSRKKKTEEAKASGEKIKSNEAISVDFGPLQKRVDGNAKALNDLQETVGKLSKGSSESFEQLFGIVNDLRNDNWILRELLVRVYKLYENPDAVDEIVAELDAQCEGGGDEEGN